MLLSYRRNYGKSRLWRSCKPCLGRRWSRKEESICLEAVVVQKGYNRDIFFFKVQEEQIGLNDAEKFIENCKDLGYECHQQERCEHYFDYFPSKVILIAPHFSPTALEKLEEITHFDENQNKHYIISNQIGKHSRNMAIKRKFPMLRCHVELWKWVNTYPERIFS